MNWFQKNFKTLIYFAFLVPIITVAIVSISHVTKWYGISNPFSWAIYLSVGIEIAALSALAAIAAQMGKKVYFPFIIVTLIQFIGNIFFAYQYIDINSQSFKDWVDMVDPIVSFMGVESGDFVGHKRFLALFAGGMLPIISLSFLHMLVKFEEEGKKDKTIEIDIEELSRKAGKMEAAIEEERYVPSEEDLQKLNEELNKIQQYQEIEPEEIRNKRRLSYLKRDAQT
jgi:phosphoglycerol transferase MdoB-like AlkP superfamily enzyme